MPKLALRERGWIWLWVSVLVILIDHYSKLAALHHLELLNPLVVFPFFNLTLAYNTGAAFGFLHQFPGWQNIFLGGLACVVSVVILIALWQRSARLYWTNIAMCLILGGALGNVLDRIVYGFVVDFISLHWGDWYFAIFNVADSAITIGAIMLLLAWCRPPVE